MIEKAFQQTTAILFGKSLTGLIDHSEWLNENVGEIVESKSALSDQTVYSAPSLFYKYIAGSVAKMDEALNLGNKSLSEKDVESLTVSNAKTKLKEIKTTSPELAFGNSENVVECTTCFDSYNSFRTSFLIKSRCAAYCYWPRITEYVFGCSLIFSSKFCINCYHSSHLTRCFELSDCTNCRDSYFCHNSEGLSDCMFCFNVKNKRYAIGNIELGKEKYDKIKAIVLADIVKKLEKNKKLETHIFNIGR